MQFEQTSVFNRSAYSRLLMENRCRYFFKALLLTDWQVYSFALHELMTFHIFECVHDASVNVKSDHCWLWCAKWGTSSLNLFLMNNEERPAGSALADWIWVVEISFLIATWQSKASLMKICVHAQYLYFWCTTTMTVPKKKKKKCRRCAGIFEKDENRKSCGNMNCIWCNKMMDCSLLFSIVYWGLILQLQTHGCAHTHTGLWSICVSIFRGYEAEVHTQLHFFKLNNWNIL